MAHIRNRHNKTPSLPHEHTIRMLRLLEKGGDSTYMRCREDDKQGMYMSLCSATWRGRFYDLFIIEELMIRPIDNLSM